MKKLTSSTVLLGCDPEFFFQKGADIIGSEKIIDIDKGLEVDIPERVNGSAFGEGKSKIIVDGVQVEINPRPDTCRARLGNEISQCMRTVYEKISSDKELKVNFSPTVKVTAKELRSLDKKSRTFGCAPSNSTNKEVAGKISVNPATYKYRSAGGHIHLGKYGSDKPFTVPELLIDVMDIIVGNTCVLIDRDEGNKIRRQVYGKAGEFRTPSYGIEYRTLSNFWLRSYPLMSLVMGLSRLAFSILDQSTETDNYQKQLFALVDMKDIHTAINENDYDLAWENYLKIKDFLIEILPEKDANYAFPITPATVNYFEYFVKKGVDAFFTEDPMEHWMKLPDGHNIGWEAFLSKEVSAAMYAEERQAALAKAPILEPVLA